METLFWFALAGYFAYQLFINRDYNLIIKVVIVLSLGAFLEDLLPSRLWLIPFVIVMMYLDYKLPDKKSVPKTTKPERQRGSLAGLVGGPPADAPLTNDAKEYMANRVYEMETLAYKKKLKGQLGKDSISGEKFKELLDLKKYGPQQK